MENPLLFLLTVLAILCTPGPTNTLLATSAATVGLRRSLALLPGEALGYLISILSLGLLLGPVLAASPTVGIGVRLLVGAYLFVLAWRLWTQGTVIQGGVRDIIGPRQIFVTTLLNPKSIIFALGVVPFGAVHVWPYVLAFLILLVMVSVGWLLLGAGIGRMAEAGGRGQMLPRIGAAAIGMFAALIVVSPMLR